MTPLQQQQKASWEDEVMEGFTESTPDLILYVVRREIASTREQTLKEVEAGMPKESVIDEAIYPFDKFEGTHNESDGYNACRAQMLSHLRTLREGITGNV